MADKYTTSVMDSRTYEVLSVNIQVDKKLHFFKKVQQQKTCSQ